MNKELWSQFGAAIDMFENALVQCPESLWNDDSRFWYIAYHTLFWTDYYLTEKSENFKPPEPYTLSEFDPEVAVPERIYDKAELLKYAEHCRSKCRDLISRFTPEIAANRWIDDSRNYSMYEITLYNMRHVMHHTGQLNLLLGKLDHDLPKWVSQTRVKL